MVSVVCKVCSGTYEAARSDAKYCSKRCKNKAVYAKRCSINKEEVLRHLATQAREYYHKNPERVRGRWLKYAYTERGTITLLLNGARDRAQRRSLPFDLDAEWLQGKLAAGVCEMSGLPIERMPPGKYKAHPYAPSLDRIQPERGYVKTNTRLVCLIVNRALGEWGDEILLNVARAIVNKHDHEKVLP